MGWVLYRLILKLSISSITTLFKKKLKKKLVIKAKKFFVVYKSTLDIPFIILNKFLQLIYSSRPFKSVIKSVQIIMQIKQTLF